MTAPLVLSISLNAAIRMKDLVILHPSSTFPYFGLTNRYPCISWWSAEQKLVQ
jgi:hypothetical protein